MDDYPIPSGFPLASKCLQEVQDLYENHFFARFHFVATGQPLDNRLRMGQIIALRFAGDDEFVALAKKAADENMPAKEIKMAIAKWKGDYHRA